VARLNPLDPESWDPLVDDILAEVRRRGYLHTNLYSTLALAPSMLRAWVGLIWPLRDDSQTARSLRELMIMRIAQLTGASYEWAHHRRMALENSVSNEKLRDLADWRVSDRFDGRERAVLAYADAIARGGEVEDATFESLRERFSDAEIVELTLTASSYVGAARLLLALEIEPEEEVRANLVDFSRG
jgi:alkylhydroperoxidase family enzyme